MPIHADPVPIEGQFLIQTQLSNLPIPPKPCQSMPILVNPVPILGQSEDICLDNLRTSALYGMVLSLLGGRNLHQSRANPWHNPESIRSIFCQFKPIQCQSGANLMSFQGQLFDPVSILQFPKPGQSEPILANPMPILANPTPISCHYWEPFV